MREIRCNPLTKEALESRLDEFRSVDADVKWMQWEDDAYRKELPGKWTLSRIAEDGARVVAYALCSSKGDEAWVHRIVVSSECRGTGVGGELLREVEEGAKASGYLSLGLKTPKANSAALNFYEANGFRSLPGEGEYVTMSKSLLPTTVGIHQPNYMPWLGYFYKMARSDVFVLLDDVLAPSRGYFNRSRVLVQGAGRWLTVPVHRGSGYINHMETSGEDWIDKHLKTIKHNYQKAPFFNEVVPEIEAVLRSHPEATLAKLNQSLIVHIAGLLSISTPTVLASDFNVESTGDERLVELVKHAGGGVYLSGRGGDNYQKPETFEAAGIELTYTGFSATPYPQLGTSEFVPGLSTLDALFNIGPEATGKLIYDAPDPVAESLP